MQSPLQSVRNKKEPIKNKNCYSTSRENNIKLDQFFFLSFFCIGILKYMYI